jgi:hypothetical protein
VYTAIDNTVVVVVVGAFRSQRPGFQAASSSTGAAGTT